MWLRRFFGLSLPPAAVESYAAPSARKTDRAAGRTVEYYPLQRAPNPSPTAHLRFALRHEPTDLALLVAVLRAVEPSVLEDWVRAEPTGAFSRRAWFFYETFTGRRLDVDDASAGNYVPALDPKRHIVAAPVTSPRHRVLDNLLGGSGMCPIIRRTDRLESARRASMNAQIRASGLMERYSPDLLARATRYLYTRETRSSFAIEGEGISPSREARFVTALEGAGQFDTSDKEALIRLQGDIVDPRYAARDWRSTQVFVSQMAAEFREEIHFVAAKPEDVPGLMDAWMAMTHRIVHSAEAYAVDPVVAAAVVSFAFVFVHPFEDGNGRVHRFLLHHVLAARRYVPQGLIFPVSAAILRDRLGYDRQLERFSIPVMALTEWRWTPEHDIVVENETADLFRFFDATEFAEYLYERLEETVRRDLRDELDFLEAFDRAYQAIRRVVDMPDRRARLFIQYCMQNGGRLPARRRSEYPELTDGEVRAMESSLADARDQSASD